MLWEGYTRQITSFCFVMVQEKTWKEEGARFVFWK